MGLMTMVGGGAYVYNVLHTNAQIVENKKNIDSLLDKNKKLENEVELHMYRINRLVGDIESMKENLPPEQDTSVILFTGAFLGAITLAAGGLLHEILR